MANEQQQIDQIRTQVRRLAAEIQATASEALKGLGFPGQWTNYGLWKE